MKTVFKYTISRTGVSTFDLPQSAVPRFFGLQHGFCCLWVEFDIADEVTRERTFQMFGTGHEIPEGAVYVGTVLDGAFVWHLYEVRR